MFDELMAERKKLKDCIKYQKALGWKEQDDSGDIVDVALEVLDVMRGYNVYRAGAPTFQMIGWFMKFDEAVEFAVDRARREIAEHEIQMAKREKS